MVDTPRAEGASGGAGRTEVQRSLPPLELLKALGDDTRYAVYLEVAGAGTPRSTAEVAATLGLHVNTVRPHLERLREVGLLEVTAATGGGVGRPQHLYAPVATAPLVPAEATGYPQLARALLAAAAEAGLDGDQLAAAGRRQGAADAAASVVPGADCLDRLAATQARQGFGPEVVHDDDGEHVAFTRCPFDDLVEDHGPLVCGLHQGQVEGFVAGCGEDRTVRFRSLADREPCRAELVP